MIAKVAIDLALDKFFDYEVPEALQKKLAIGQLLSVPFGHREARGFVMAIEPNSVDVASDRVSVASDRVSVATDRVSVASDSVDVASDRVSVASDRVSVASDSVDVASDRSADSTTTQKDPKRHYTLKPIGAIVDETPFFSARLLELVRRVADYTCSPIESVLKAALPAAVLKKNVKPHELLYLEPALAAFEVNLTKRQQWLYQQIVRLGGGWMAELCRELKTTSSSLRQLGQLGLLKVDIRAKRRDPLAGRRILPTKPLSLNIEQQNALNAILNSPPTSTPPPTPTPILLYGVTGSGKTEVYLQAIARELAEGRGAIVMVPEIALTPQTVQRFASRFSSQVAVLHSALSDGERYDEWHRIRAGEARVVVGPRSAVWAPVKNLGLIVVDEEHETSYKQDELPRYHARDVAVLRGVIEGAKVVLGSATPSLESWMNVKKSKYRLATMRCRAGLGCLPYVKLVDVSALGGAIFSPELLDAIRLRLDRGEQTILFLNRRGYSRQVVCEGCGYVIECPNCSTADRALPYTYHRADSCLRCHVCGGWIELPRVCPHCKSPRLTYKGIGTQRAEAALKVCFPKARVIRMDADSTSRKHSHDELLSIFRRGEADILLGTQMIAKGLDFPNVTLVGVLNADSSLNMPDFRSAERTFQLVSQVSGRAGRSELPGEVFIQTFDPKNEVLQAARTADFERFAVGELKNREECGFPPFVHLAVANFRSKDLRLVADWTEMYAKSLKKIKGLEVSDAMPSALEKADGWYRWQIILRAPTTLAIVRAWRWILTVRPSPKNILQALDVDALNMI